MEFVAVPPEERSLLFTCPQCAGAIEVDTLWAGISARCPHCQSTYITPDGRPQELNQFGFTEAGTSEVWAIDILIDGRSVFDFHGRGTRDAGIPFELFRGPDLPPGPYDGSIPYPDDEFRLIGVCSCGVEGCGSSWARFVREPGKVEMIMPFLTWIGRFPTRYDRHFFFGRKQFDETLHAMWEYVQARQVEILKEQLS